MRRFLVAIVAVALSVFPAVPAEANVLTGANVTDECAGFTIYVKGKDLSKPSTVTYTITLTPDHGKVQSINGSVSVTPNENGFFHATQRERWADLGVELAGTYSLTGTATLTSSGSKLPIDFSPATLTCGKISFCPGSERALDRPFTYAALGVGDNHGQNAQIQGQQGSEINGLAGIAGPHGQIQLQGWQQFNLPGLIGGRALVQSDTQIQLDNDSFIKGGVHINTDAPPEAAQMALADNARFASLQATEGPNTINIQGPNKGSHEVVTITGNDPRQNVLQLQQLQLQFVDLYFKAPPGSSFIVNVAQQIQLQNSNIFAEGISPSRILLNSIGNQNVQMQNENDPDPDPDALVEASILAPGGGNVQLESMEIVGDVIFGQQLQMHENTRILACSRPPGINPAQKPFARPTVRRIGH